MKRILIVTHAIDFGGVGTVLINLTDALIKRGYEVTVVSTSKRVPRAAELNARIKVIVKDEKKFPFLVGLKGIKNFFGPGYWFRRQGPLQLYRYFVGKSDFDVEIAFFYGRPVKVVYGSPEKKSVKIAWIHSDFKECSGYFGGFKKPEEAIKAYNQFDSVVCVSKQAERSFKEIIGRHSGVTTIYNVNNIDKILSLSVKQVDITPERFTVIAVGRLAEEKGFGRLLDASFRLTEMSIAHDVWIVGDGPQREVLERFVSDNQMVNVRMFGNQSNPYPFIKKADLLVCSSYYEGYNLTIAEALILGIPVLSTDCTGPTEILDNGNYGMIVENSVKGLADGLAVMITDNVIYNHYRKKAQARLDFFDNTNIMNQVESLFGKQ